MHCNELSCQQPQTPPSSSSHSSGVPDACQGRAVSDFQKKKDSRTITYHLTKTKFDDWSLSSKSVSDFESDQYDNQNGTTQKYLKKLMKKRKIRWTGGKSRTKLLVQKNYWCNNCFPVPIQGESVCCSELRFPSSVFHGNRFKLLLFTNFDLLIIQ